jgi:hypothetical protein
MVCVSQEHKKSRISMIRLFLSEKRDSNPRPQPWQGCALPAELFSLVRHKI